MNSSNSSMWCSGSGSWPSEAQSASAPVTAGSALRRSTGGFQKAQGVYSKENAEISSLGHTNKQIVSYPV